MQENPLGYEKIPKLLKSFAVPSITAMMVSSLYNIVDQIFIGQGVGYLGNAATNVAFPLSTISLALALLVGVGSAARFSLCLGRGDREQAAKVAGGSLSLMSLAALLFLVFSFSLLTPLLKLFGATADILPYAVEYSKVTLIGMPFLMVTNSLSNLIRADGSPKWSMLCMVAGAVVNTVLDPIFIFSFDMGVFGAALATIIGQFISFLMAIAYLPRFKTVELSRDCFKLDLKDGMRTCAMGMSNAANQLCITLVQVVMNNSLSYYGAMSVYGQDIPLAACGIVMKTNSILIAVIVGLSQGMQPIVGFNYGARKYDRVKQAYSLAVKWSLLVGFAVFLAFQLLPHAIVSLYGGGEPLYYEFAIKFMRSFLFMVPVIGIQMLSSNLFTSIGKVTRGLMLSLTRQVFFLIPLLMILPLFMGIDGVLISGPISDFAAFILTMIFVVKEFRLQAKQMEQLV